MNKIVTKEQYETVNKLETLYFKETSKIYENNKKWADSISKGKENPYTPMDNIPYFNGVLFMKAHVDVVSERWNNNVLESETKTTWFWEEGNFEIYKGAYEWAVKNGLTITNG